MASGRDKAAQRPGQQDEQAAEASAWQAETGYQPSVNQRRREPIPASHHERSAQEGGHPNGKRDSDRPDGGG
jgi:hypothetical protein